MKTQIVHSSIYMHHGWNSKLVTATGVYLDRIILNPHEKFHYLLKARNQVDFSSRNTKPEKGWLQKKFQFKRSSSQNKLH